MAEATVTYESPTVDGNTKTVIAHITANAANNDTITKHGLTEVFSAVFEPDASGVTHGIAKSGTGNTTLTLKLSGAAKGDVVIRGR